MTNNPENLKRAYFHVHGFVQGVGYRYFARRAALELMLAGKAKNEYDGTVTLTVEGNSERIATFLSILKTGPSRSSVTRIIEEYSAFVGDLRGFSIE